MTTSTSLQTQLETVLYGKPWYGDAVYRILDDVSFEAAYERALGASHTVAQIVIHMLAWTEEVIARMNRMQAGTPAGGDWPDPGAAEIDNWEQLKANLKLANSQLAQLVGKFPPEQWNEPTNDDRETYVGYGLTYKAMIFGLIQHHVYHAAQISLLNKMING